MSRGVLTVVTDLAPGTSALVVSVRGAKVFGPDHDATVRRLGGASRS